MVWKLLRQHLSIPQLLGFVLANLFGMIIILLGVQFYTDISPILSQNDSFMKSDYIIVSKKVNTLGTLVGRSNAFTNQEIEEIQKQSFAERVGKFTSSQFSVSAGIGMQGMQLSTAMFFESVPDAYLDVKLDKWNFDETQSHIPIIIPKGYLDMYNFGFASSRSLPQLSEGLLGMMNLKIKVSGQGQTATFIGQVVGFSNRLNTILVPEKFMVWANQRFGASKTSRVTRLIVEVKNPADDEIVKFLSKKGYETQGNGLDSGRITWFLKLTTGIVLSIGIIICALSFYILVLSIYLLLQKNVTKMESLLLLGYSPSQVARPYQILSGMLNISVLIISLLVVALLRSLYIDSVNNLFPVDYSPTAIPAVVTGIFLLLMVLVLNYLIIHRKITSIWENKKT